MLRFPVRWRTLVLVLVFTHLVVFLYFRKTGTRYEIVHEPKSIERKLKIPELRINSSQFLNPKYPSLNPQLYDDLWRIPIGSFEVPLDAAGMSESKCADVFGARFTTYCEKVTRKVIENIGKRRSSNVGGNAVEFTQDFLLEYCPCFPPSLIGRQRISDIILERNQTESQREHGSQEPYTEPVLPGGRWAPKDCRARQRVAVIIPFRDRHSHLENLLSHLHPMLQRQQLDYTIFVIEQNKPLKIFNKGMLMNAGFTEIHGPNGIPRNKQTSYSTTPGERSNISRKILNFANGANDGTTDVTSSMDFNSEARNLDSTASSAGDGASKINSKNGGVKYSSSRTNANASLGYSNFSNGDISSENTTVLQSDSTNLGPNFWGSFDCYIFHDVDMVPEDDRNIYSCTKNPRHVGVYISKYNYTRCCGALFGGATAFTPQHFVSVNGYSNEYYGWGGEDDDMLFRLRWQQIFHISYPRCVSRFTMIKHERDKRNSENPNRVIAVKSRPEVYKQVGLSSLTYDVVKTELRPLYTWILFDLPESIQLPDGTIVPRFERTKDGKIIRLA